MTESIKLLDACRKRDVVEFQQLLPQVRDPADLRDLSRKTVLHYSCRHGWLDVTKRLVEQYHCDPESRDNGGDTPLIEACYNGRVDIVRYLVSEQECCTVFQNRWDGDTPLHMACRNGHLAMVKALTSGPDCKTACNCQNKYGDSPLHVACHKGHVDIVRYLVSEQGCSTACRNKNGDSPLHVACHKGHVDIVKYLVSEQGCSTACQNKNDDSPLHVGCREGHLSVVEYLLTGKDCSVACIFRNNYGKTLLHYSCHHGWLDVTRKLVEWFHCDPESGDDDGDTPLHVACHVGHVDIVSYLVSEQKCSVACQNKDCDTPLHVACREGHVDIVAYLVSERECSTACTNKKGDTPLQLACRVGHVDIVRFLVGEQGCSTACQNKDGDTLLHEACRVCHVDTVRYLVSEQKCSVACQNKLGDTPLHHACRAGHLAVTEILLTGQDCSAACISENNYGKTLLHYSCHHGWLDVTRRLVELYHCDPESRDNGGDTPLHATCREGHVDISRYLVSQQGCSTACQNKDGDTPLHVACRWDWTSVVQFLLSTGRVDPWRTNAINLTPVQLTGNYEISKLFAKLTKGDPVTATKVFIFGNPATGKSTLVKVIENKVTSRFGALAGQFRNVSGVELRTAGINTVTVQNSGLGTVTIYDLAGQLEYYSSHDALVGNLMSCSAAIFIAVVKVHESEAEMIRTLRYWVSFIENCCSRVEATAHLMVVGSWADKVKEAGENIDQKWSNIKKACISSSSPLHFVGFTALDCRKLASSGLDKICDMIGSSCTALREAAEQNEFVYPHLLHAFISTKLKTQVAYSVKELCTHITAEDDALLPTEPNLLSPLLSTLSDGGHLLYLPNKDDLKAGWVVINKQAVLSEINGTIFAPEYFKQHHDIATSTGVVPESKIAGVFAKKYDINMILCLLTLFEFCQKIKDSSTLSLIASCDPSRDDAAAMNVSVESSESYYFFPALVRVEHPTDVWQSSDPGQYQFGWCLQCSKEGHYLTPRFLHVLLLRLAFSFSLASDSSHQDEASPVLRRRCAIWKNGIQWLDQDGVETIVEVSEQNKVGVATDGVSRGRGDGVCSTSFFTHLKDPGSKEQNLPWNIYH